VISLAATVAFNVCHKKSNCTPINVHG